jgi:hypothetical protein
MKVSKLIEFLMEQDQDKEVQIWKGEWDCKDPLQHIEIDEDGDIVIFN